MYSFLVTSNVGAWDSRTYEYRRERFCQYTEDVIKQQFWTLTAEAIVQLQAFPVLFAYEGTTADVRVGYIRRVVDRRDRDTVFIEFDFEYRFPRPGFDRERGHGHRRRRRAGRP